MSNEDLFVQGEDRRQSLFLLLLLDEYVSQDNEVRFVDAFVESLDPKQLGFKYSGRYEITFTPVDRPPFDPRDLLKLYIWGYLNAVRSSRKLHKEYEKESGGSLVDEETDSRRQDNL
jgi:transposase